MGGTDPVFEGHCERCERAGDENFPQGCEGCKWDFKKNKPTRFIDFRSSKK